MPEQETYYNDLDDDVIYTEKSIGDDLDRRAENKARAEKNMEFYKLHVGTVIKFNEEQTVDIQDGEVSEDGSIPRRIYKNCRICGNFGEDENEEFYGDKFPVKKGTRVLYGFVQGHEQVPIILGLFLAPVKNNKSITLCKNENTDKDHFYQNGKLKIRKKENGDYEIETEKAKFQVTNDGDIVMNEGSKGVARKDDETEVYIKASEIASLGLIAGPYTVTAPSPTNQVTSKGKITESSDTVKAGD